MNEQEYIVIFEDYKYKNFLPITLTMPVFMLKHGFMSNLERILRIFKGKGITLLTRKYLSEITHYETRFTVNDDIGVNNNDTIIFINGRLTNPEDIRLSTSNNGEKAIFNDDNLIYLKIKRSRLNGEINEFFLRKDTIEIIKDWDIDKEYQEIGCANYPWDLIYNNSNRIIKDYETLIKQGSIQGEFDPLVQLYNKNDIYIGNGSRVMSGTVIIAEDGPVVIDNDVKVMPNSVIYGPCYIGKKSLIKAGATIYEGTTIGEVCKIGGEVEDAIVHSFSNKQHYGFLGHSYIGKWCNLGAGTSNSDLKNNYGNIKMQIGNEKVDTGKIFMGMLMGDHSKTAINTSINTGTVIGVMCNIFTRDFPDKYIPSFSWVGKKVEKYDFNKALQTARRVMARRNKELTEIDISVLKYIYDESNKKNSLN